MPVIWRGQVWEIGLLPRIVDEKRYLPWFLRRVALCQTLCDRGHQGRESAKRAQCAL